MSTSEAAYSAEQIQLLRRTFAGEASEKLSSDQFELFMQRVHSTGLDPFTNQISAQARWNKRNQRYDLTIITGIDGFRHIAARTGERDGEEAALWCGADGVWKEVWLSDKPPVACKYIVYRKGESHPYVAIAKYEAYKPSNMNSWDWWAKAPDHMLAKVTEALALRKAFPNEMSGIYTNDEMRQAAPAEERKSSPGKAGKAEGPPTGGDFRWPSQRTDPTPPPSNGSGPNTPPSGTTTQATTTTAGQQEISGTPTDPGAAQLADEYIRSFAGCASKGELQEIGRRLKGVDFGAERPRLVQAYTKRLGELS